MVFRCLAVVALGLLCCGCVVAPPPPVPVATASPPAQNCREFQQNVIVGGRTERAYGTSCQQPDGSWRIAQPSETAPAAPAIAAYPASPYPAYYPGYYYAPYPRYYAPFYGGVRIGFRGRF